MRLSRFGQKIAGHSGIGQLMEDLTDALAGGEGLLMLGGGNPAHIPAMQKRFRAAMQNVLEEPGRFERTVGNYDSARGNKEFIAALAKLLREQCGWDVGTENIALTNGSQTAFFVLFNLFAGEFDDGAFRRILLPLVPEYIGYSDVGLKKDFFVSTPAKIDFLDEHTFKYAIDFDSVPLDDSIGAICVSRPTNPSGNVLTDAEIARLSDLAAERDIPLIIDNAYGAPFPGMIFTEAHATWNPNTIMCLSLSKLGLPAARTGIVVARREVIDALERVTSIMSLAPNGFGAAIAREFVQTGEILHLANEVIRPFYEEKAQRAAALLRDGLDGLDYFLHKPEGALFLWVWFRDLPITSAEFYERLKARGVLVIPGHYFFPGLREEWKHQHECLRITYSQDDAVVTEGIRIISEEARRAYGD